MAARLLLILLSTHVGIFDLCLFAYVARATHKRHARGSAARVTVARAHAQPGGRRGVAQRAHARAATSRPDPAQGHHQGSHLRRTCACFVSYFDTYA